jgi:hypothetical protein
MGVPTDINGWGAQALRYRPGVSLVSLGAHASRLLGRAAPGALLISTQVDKEGATFMHSYDRS